MATAQSDLADLQAVLDDANATIADQEQQITDLTAKVDTGQAAATDVQGKLAAETERADKAESDLAALQAQVDAVAANFPVTITSSLEPFADHRRLQLTLTEAFCDGIATLWAAAAGGPGRHHPGSERPAAAGAERVHDRPVHDRGLAVRCHRQRPHRGPVRRRNADQLAGLDDDLRQRHRRSTSTVPQTLSGLGASLFVAVNPAGSCGAGNVFFSGTLTPA